MDTNREEEHLDEGAFDESKALEALERMREEIVRYQAMRENVSDQFERFIQSFKKPEPLAPAAVVQPPRSTAPIAPASAIAEATALTPVVPPPIPPATADLSVSRVDQPQVASTEPPIPSPEPRVPSPEPRVPTPEPRVPTPEPRVPSPQPPVPSPEVSVAPPLPPVPPETPFEPLSLEPFARQIEGPRVDRHLVVPTSPEAFAAAREEEDPDVTFAPGEAFDALPPPLPAIDDSVTLSPPPPPPRPAQTRTWVLLGGVVMILAVGAYMWMQGQTPEATVAEQPAPAPSGEPPARSQRPTETGQATTGSSQSAPATPPPAATLQTEIVTTEPAWVRVIADGERVIERELPAAARIPFKAERTIQIRTGNAGAVRLSIRGKDQGALGKIGEVVTRSFTVPAR